jgi:peptide/nickel transport system ATP-binding protein
MDSRGTQTLELGGTGGDLILEVRSLKKYFPIKTTFLRRVIGYVKAVDDVDLIVRRGETLGLVGESGCGKTTLGRCVLRSIEPTDGEVVYQLSDGQHIDILSLEAAELRQVRRNMQMIFQDPYSSLDPRMSVLDIIGEPLIIGNVHHAQVVERVEELMALVGLDPRYLKRYPHAFSGGQRQRIAIARALATNPQFIVCDEPVSALDVSVRAQILNLLLELQERLNLSYLFISHDLSVIRHISHRVGVMYVGKMVELASTVELFRKPLHPYSEALLSAIPMPDPRLKVEQILLAGEVANPANPPGGCYFHPRCAHAADICRTDPPSWREVEPEHWVACHFAPDLALRGVEV